MKYFLPFATVLSLTAGSFAQTARIVSPAANADIKAGSEITLRIETNFLVFSANPNSKQGDKRDKRDNKYPVGSVEHVGIALGLQSCASKGCEPIDKEFGYLLYKGPYDPKADSSENMHQEFKVKIPSDIPKGQAVLGSLHLVVFGVEGDRTSEHDTSEVKVNIV
ncbi:hypothetical protein Moror_11876 [Moniliophthora roreri MCA 2997]|nr:hypothetical protein Moror_11876 [Moniliophthora roreri MCA 2997]KAI3606076.1 hypothetical protein WG66_003899 [Moniliophthora roreri]